jgi:hypothetical protein
VLGFTPTLGQVRVATIRDIQTQIVGEGAKMNQNPRRQGNCCLMVWHSDNISINGLVKCVVKSKTWAHIDVMWLEFVVELCNVRF